MLALSGMVVMMLVVLGFSQNLASCLGSEEVALGRWPELKRGVARVGWWLICRQGVEPMDGAFPLLMLMSGMSDGMPLGPRSCLTHGQHLQSRGSQVAHFRVE